jgi:ribonucleotide reductase alpha subunit
MRIARKFTKAGRSPYESIVFETRSSESRDKNGNITYSCNTVVVPSTWSQIATDILAQKYFRRRGVNHEHDNALNKSGVSSHWAADVAHYGDAETDVRQTIHRIVGCWTDWGMTYGYFSGDRDALAFYDEMSYMMATQRFAPNSPQWFNTGLFWAYGIDSAAQGHFYVDPHSNELEESESAYQRVQAHACYIQKVTDDLVGQGGIFDLFTREARLFKYGSGSGANYSSLRGEGEPLSGGGRSSGLLSFLKVGDQGAGSVKSGGTTRRAARMVVLNADHPDVEQFIDWKVNEERKVVALAVGSLQMKNFWKDIREASPEKKKSVVTKYRKLGVSLPFISQCLARLEQGDSADDIETYDLSWEGEGYGTVSGMNANNIVRVTDEFMRAVEKDGSWATKFRTNGEVAKTLPAKELMNRINRASFLCGDPGLHFDTTINDWHTIPKSGRINASNPCCLVGDTEVDTSEGRIRIDWLAEMARGTTPLPMVFAWDLSDKLPALRRITKVWMTGETTRLMRVTTDKGLTFTCTPDHRFLTRDGAYVEAQHLRAGKTRLRKIGRWINHKRSNRYAINHRTTEAHLNGTVIQARWMWEQLYGSIPDDMDVHHRNEDPTDDRLSNFELKPFREHQREHSSGIKNPRFLQVEDRLLVEVWEAIEEKPKVMRRDRPKVTPATWNSFVRNNNLKGVVPLAGSPTYGGRIQGMAWAQFKQHIEQHRDLVNDKVATVEEITLDTTVPVYNMVVAGDRNFAICSGKAVHSIVVESFNCLPSRDALADLAPQGGGLQDHEPTSNNQYSVMPFTGVPPYQVMEPSEAS